MIEREPDDSYNNSEPLDSKDIDSKHKEPKTPLKLSISYPWLSPVGALLLMCAHIALNESGYIIQGLSVNYVTQEIPLNWIIQGSLLFCVFVLIFWDLKKFFNQKKGNQSKIRKLEDELKFSWANRKKLQKRTHLYFDHADKLKRFISDKLIEQIEYDDKFLHFKSIAAEIRHNGVISYDIVRSALEKAVKENDGQANSSLNSINLADTHRFGLPNNPNSSNQQALQAMKYLWDLLDLSTADNIALHIGNYLIDCEERYYQWELNKSNESPLYNTGSIAPTFTPSHAALKAMAPFLAGDELIGEELTEKELAGEELIDENLTENRFLKKSLHQNEPTAFDIKGADNRATIDVSDIHDAPLPDTSDTSTIHSISRGDAPSSYSQNTQFRISLSKTGGLLGNENHIILLLENLIKNAQYFSTKAAYKQSSDRIAIQLYQKGAYVYLTVYNRGPLVSLEDKENIFKMGYTTRRSKVHHGKGLGLFFVNEIVKGYQGSVAIQNITNKEQTYTIRMALQNKTVVTKVIERRLLNDKPHVRELNAESLESSIRWELDAPISSIEVSSNSDNRTHVFTDADCKEASRQLDPSSPFMPEWVLDINNKKKSNAVIFSALDIRGVEFSVKLPTAEARLSGEDFDEEELQDLLS
ncbi:MAG: hypothetical protein ACI93R_002409 [Flavobacteriales bacterium]